MKRVLIVTVYILFYSLGIAQTSVVDYTIIGNESNEYASDVDTLNDFIYISGNTNECGNNNGFILKYKDDSIYKRTLIGDYNVDIIEAVESRIDGKLFLAGYTDQNSDYDILLAKLDTQLNTISEQILEIENWNFCYDIALNNNSIIGAGKTHNGLDYDAFVFKVDNNLDTVWTSTISNSNNQQLNKVIAYNDTIYIAAGYSELDGVGKDIYLVSLNANTGDTLWTQTIGGVNDDFCSSIIKSQDGGIVGFGTTSSYTSDDEDTFLFKTDSSGNFMWSNLHQVQSTSNTLNDNGIDLYEQQNGDLIVAAITESFGPTVGAKSTMIMKTNSNGDWLNGYIYDGGNDDFPVAIIKENDTLFYVSGIANSNSFGYSDIYLLKMSTNDINSQMNTVLFYKNIDKTCFSNIEKSIQTEKSISVFPNPITQGFQIKSELNESVVIQILDILGNEVLNKEVQVNTIYQFPKYCNNGIYVINIHEADGVTNQYKVIYDK